MTNQEAKTICIAFALIASLEAVIYRATHEFAPSGRLADEGLGSNMPPDNEALNCVSMLGWLCMVVIALYCIYKGALNQNFNDNTENIN